MIRAEPPSLLTWVRSHWSLLGVGFASTGTDGAGPFHLFGREGNASSRSPGADNAVRRAEAKCADVNAITAANTAASGQRVEVAKNRHG